MRIDFFSPAARPIHEDARQAAVDGSGLLRGRSGPDLQRIVERAAQRFDMPIAAISVIDRHRQWLAARTGVEVQEMPRAVSFCAHAIHRPGEPLLVRDVADDQRFSANPLVIEDPHVRFYAGVPLVDRNGYALGALCVIDTKPRPEGVDVFELSLLAREAEGLINR